MRTEEQSEKEMVKTNEVKEVYEKPAIEIIEMEMEGMLCSSGDGFGDGGGGQW